MWSNGRTSVYYLQVYAPLRIYPCIKSSSPDHKATKRVGIWIRTFGDSIEDDVADGTNIVTIGRGNPTGTQTWCVVSQVAFEGFGV